MVQFADLRLFVQRREALDSVASEAVQSFAPGLMPLGWHKILLPGFMLSGISIRVSRASRKPMGRRCMFWPKGLFMITIVQNRAMEAAIPNTQEFRHGWSLVQFMVLLIALTLM